MNSSSKEDYLLEIYRLQQLANSSVSVSDIARKMMVSKPSVSQMVRKLGRQQLVRANRYGSVSLTGKGAENARQLLRKHRLIERFLADMLCMDDYHAEAHMLEHTVSDKVADKMARLLKNPTSCPDGKHIPLKSAKIVTLDKLMPKTTAVLVFTQLQDSAVAQRLKALGLVPRTVIRVAKKLSNGPLLIEVKGSQIALGRDICKQIMVEAE